MNECIDTILKRKSVRIYLPEAIPEEQKQQVIDAILRAPTAVLAAESLGIGSCYIGDIMENYEIHRDLLNLPPYAAPVTMICFGYPTEQQKARPYTPRLPQELLVTKNSYRRLTPQDAGELEKMNRRL